MSAMGEYRVLLGSTAGVQGEQYKREAACFNDLSHVTHRDSELSLSNFMIMADTCARHGLLIGVVSRILLETTDGANKILQYYNTFQETRLVGCIKIKLRDLGVKDGLQQKESEIDIGVVLMRSRRMPITLEISG